MYNEPKETHDLLAVYKKDSTNAQPINANAPNIKRDIVEKPPDGGTRAYLVLIGSFLTNGLLFGVINSYSVIYKELQKQFQQAGMQNSETRASLIGSLAMGTTFILSPLSGVLTGLLGIRMTAVLGGCIGALGMLISSFVTEHGTALCFTYGIMYGLGVSLAYTPSLTILGHYYEKYLGFVNGFVTIGSCVFTVFMPVLIQYFITSYSLPWAFRMLSVFTFGVAFCGLLFKPIPLMVLQKSDDKKVADSLIKTILVFDIWKNKKYRLWAFSIPVALFGYFVPYVHINKYIELNFKGENANLPLQCLAVMSGVGRLVFGILADKPGMDKILLQQISFYVIGSLTILLPFVKSFWLIVAISLGMGIFDGAFISLIGPIAFELCGAAFAAQAIGCMLGLAATPLSVGPAVAGYLFSMYKSYTLSFVLAGISPIIGASIMFAIRFHGRDNNVSHVTANGHSPRSGNEALDIEKSANAETSINDAHHIEDQRL